MPGSCSTPELKNDFSLDTVIKPAQNIPNMIYNRFERGHIHLRTLYYDRKFEDCLTVAKTICDNPSTESYWLIQAAIVAIYAAIYATDDIDEAWTWTKYAELHISEWHESWKDTLSDEEDFADLFEMLWGQLADAVTAVNEEFELEDMANETNPEAVDANEGKEGADREEKVETSLDDGVAAS